MANKTINEITNVSTQANDDDLLVMWDKNREKTVKIKNKDFNKNNQPKTLETPIEVDNVEETTVEGALGAINDKVKNFTVSDAVEDGNMNPVTSNAVYDLFELDTVESGEITISAGGYQEWQSTISNSKSGYHLVSAIAGPVGSVSSIDATICNVHNYNGYFRVTIYNAAGISQTSKFALRVFWMKD